MGEQKAKRTCYFVIWNIKYHFATLGPLRLFVELYNLNKFDNIIHLGI